MPRWHELQDIWGEHLRRMKGSQPRMWRAGLDPVTGLRGEWDRGGRRDGQERVRLKHVAQEMSAMPMGRPWANITVKHISLEGAWISTPQCSVFGSSPGKHGVLGTCLEPSPQTMLRITGFQNLLSTQPRVCFQGLRRPIPGLSCWGDTGLWCTTQDPEVAKEQLFAGGVCGVGALHVHIWAFLSEGRLEAERGDGPVLRLGTSSPASPCAWGNSEGQGSYMQTWPARSFHKEYFQGRRINMFYPKLDG